MACAKLYHSHLSTTVAQQLPGSIKSFGDVSFVDKIKTLWWDVIQRNIMNHPSIFLISKQDKVKKSIIRRVVPERFKTVSSHMTHCEPELAGEDSHPKFNESYLGTWPNLPQNYQWNLSGTWRDNVGTDKKRYIHNLCGLFNIMVIVFQFQDKSVCVSFCVNALGKRFNPSSLSSVIGE